MAWGGSPSAMETRQSGKIAPSRVEGSPEQTNSSTRASRPSMARRARAMTAERLAAAPPCTTQHRQPPGSPSWSGRDTYPWGLLLPRKYRKTLSMDGSSVHCKVF